MSKWIEQFKSHQLQKNWAVIMENLPQMAAEDLSDAEMVPDIARLRKVVMYFDAFLKSADPEIIPLGLWDSLNAESMGLVDQFVSFNNNPNLANLRTANDKLDSMLSHIRPYTVVSDQQLFNMRDSMFQYNETIGQALTLIRSDMRHAVDDTKTFKQNAQEAYKHIQEVWSEIALLNAQLIGDSESTIEASIKTKFNKLLENYNKLYEDIVAYHLEVFEGIGEKEPLKKMIKDSEDSAREIVKLMDESFEETMARNSELGAFHTKIFGKAGDENGNPVQGLKGELDVRINALSEFETLQKVKFDALNKQIESLIPGATSAGLATAYKDMADSFVAPIKNATRLFYVCIGALVFMAFVSSIGSISLNPFALTFTNYSDTMDALKGILIRGPILAPILWLAVFANRRRSENQRLQQEYAHKEALAKSYKGYKDQLIALGDPDFEMQKDLIKKAIEAIAYNASTTLDNSHGDKMPLQEALEKALDGVQKSKSIVDKFAETVKPNKA